MNVFFLPLNRDVKEEDLYGVCLEFTVVSEVADRLVQDLSGQGSVRGQGSIHATRKTSGICVKEIIHTTVAPGWRPVRTAGPTYPCDPV